MIIQSINPDVISAFGSGSYVILCFIAASLSFKEGRSSEDERKTQFYYCFLFHFILMGIAFIYFAIFNDVIVELYGIKYIGEYIVFFGFFFYIRGLESIFERTKGRVSIFYLCLIFLLILFNDYGMILIVGVIGLTFALLILIQLIRMSTADYEMIAIFMTIYWILGAGATFLNTLQLTLNIWSDIFQGLSVVFYLTVIYMTPEKLEKLKKRYFLWIIIGFTIIFTFLGVYVFIESQSFVHFISVFVFYLPMPFLLRGANTKSREVSDEKPKALSIIARPSRVTEEEISISKEKKACLVCKNSVSRQNYICPDCNAFYCNKCSGVLAGAENSCWVCESPFDESKPVKKPESLQEEIELEPSTHKANRGK